jgi:hypothetical protein
VSIFNYKICNPHSVIWLINFITDLNIIYVIDITTLNRRKVLSDQIKKGDKVEWNTSKGKTTGEVKQKLTSPTDIQGHHVAASKEHPEYLVESDKTGKPVAHKADALHKIEE